MISRYSVKKPFTVLVGVLLVIVLGVVSLGRMTTDLLPDMSFQYALIVTTDMGASPRRWRAMSPRRLKQLWQLRQISKT